MMTDMEVHKDVGELASYELVFKDLNVRIGKRNILSNISGLAKPGEMMAIMGPSGSGKTTLLNCLAGRRGMDSGIITMNSRLINKQLRRKISFVLQNDIFLSQLTCWETIWYTALLRLPGSMPTQEKKRRVNEILDTLDMRRCLETKVGDVGHRGLSGGERKRTTIACELLTNPSLMLLDEPTSGLDSSTAYSLCSTIKNFARNSGKTVIMTIHQPSSKIFNMFDRLLLLCEGKTAYFGDIKHCARFFSGIGLPCPTNYNLADHILDQVKESEEIKKKIVQRALKQKCEPWYPQQLQSETSILHIVSENGFHVESESLLSANQAGTQMLNGSVKLHSSFNGCSDQVPTKSIIDEGSVRFDETTFYDDTDELRFKKEFASKWPTGFYNQYSVLVKRSFWQALPRILSKWQIFQVLITSVMGGLLWLNMEPTEERMTDRHGLLFFGVIYTAFTGLIDAMLSFPAERTVLNKERLAGYYRLSAYYLAKISSDVPLMLLLPTTHITITFWMSLVNPNFITYIQVLCNILMSSILAHSIAMFYSALILDMAVSIMLSTTTMLVLTIAGGFYARHVPKWIGWLKYISYPQHTFYAILNIDFNSIDIRCSSTASRYPSCLGGDNATHVTNYTRYIPKVDLLNEYTLRSYGWETGHHMSVILLLTLISMSATYIVLRFIRKPHLN